MKTLLIDFDLYNRSIQVLYNRFQDSIDYIKLSNNILKISTVENLLFLDEKILENNNIVSFIKELKQKYEQVVIDMSGNPQSKFFKQILDISDDIIFVMIPTLCDLKKSLNLYEIIKVDYNTPVEKIKLFINKENKSSVDNLIIQKIFDGKKISGRLKYNEGIENNIGSKTRIKMEW